MWHRYAKRTIGWLCPSSSKCKEVRGQPQRDRGRTSGTMCTCEEIERGTHAQRASKLGPIEQSSDGGLRMVNWESQSKSPPHSPEDGHIYCILLIRIVFCHVSKHLPLHCLFYVTVNIYFNTAYDVVTGLLIFVNIYHLTHTLLHAHTEAHTHKHTYMISTQEEWRQPGTGAWSGGAEEKLLREKKAWHTHFPWCVLKHWKKKMSAKPICRPKNIWAQKASSKAIRQFLTM